MTRNEILKELASLPTGGVTYKTINGKKYAYYQWRENGKQKARRVQIDELDTLVAQVARRKELEYMLRTLPATENNFEEIKSHTASYEFKADTRIGVQLHNFCQGVADWKKRECFTQLENYIYGPHVDRVFILYGLRRTGKTTLLRQVIEEMDEEHFAKSAYLKLSETTTLADVRRDLDTLEAEGFRYVFLDEVTLMEDFIEGAALFSDIYAASGMRVVLSGTDSLGFRFAEDEQLYDRCIFLHTTFIPYREFEEVLGLQGIDEFIRYGGTMSLGGATYREPGTFQNAKEAGAYVDSAIAHNIQHSLKHYQEEGHFRALKELYDHGELTSAVNRVVEDMNHEFTRKVLTRDFKSHDLGVTKRNLVKDKKQPNYALEEIDLSAVTERLRKALSIVNQDEMQVDITEEQVTQIRSYLKLLDLVVDIDVMHFNERGFTGSSEEVAVSQPGLRYAQAKLLIESLLGDASFSELSLAERTAVTERILSEVRGRMLEELVLLETKMARSDAQVFKLQFEVGEFDMVVFTPSTASCELYEIKHSAEQVPEQYRHLVNAQKCALAEFRYGTITGKYVLYRGTTTPINAEGITYWNVEDYLRHLGALQPVV